MQRSLQVVESRASAVELSSCEARLLNDLGRELASKKRFWKSLEDEGDSRSVIRCVFDGAQWMLTVYNAVGMIRAGDLQILVTPKIPMVHFVYLLSACDYIPRFVRDEVSVAASKDLLALVAHWFMYAADGVLKRDLIRDYVEQLDDLDAARGQLDPLATGSQYYAGRLLMNCRFEEFDLDTPLNRLLKAGVRTIASEEHFSSSLRRSASRTLQRLDSVGTLRSGDLVARSDRRTTHYDDALMLARLLIAGQSRGPAFGGSTAWSFLIPTPDAVESAVRALLAERLQLPCVVTNRGRMLRPTALTVNPDLVFEPGLAVGDIKYKIDWEEMPRSDLYQAVSFASAYEMSKAALVSFKTTARRPLQDIPFGDVVVQHLCWDATQGTSPEDAADRLVRSVQQWLGIGPGVTVECAAR